MVRIVNPPTLHVTLNNTKTVSMPSTPAPRMHVHTHTYAQLTVGETLYSTRESATAQMWLIADSTYFQITTGILHHYIPFAPFQTAPSHAPALIIYNLCLMLHLRFEWELGNVGALFVCLLIEHFPLG